MGQISALESAIHTILGSLSVPRNRRKAMLLLFSELERGELLEKCRLWLIDLDKERHKKIKGTRLEPRMTPPLEGVPKEVIVEAYADREKMSLRRAMLDIAKQLELILDSDWRFLIQDLAVEEKNEPPPADVPELRKDGTLVYRGEVIAKFRQTRFKSRYLKVLELFQSHGWVTEVENTVFSQHRVLPDVADRLRLRTKGKLHFSGSKANNKFSWRAI